MTKSAVFICLFALLVGSMFGFSSCRKNDRAADTELQSSRDMSLALAAWNDVFRQTDIFASAQPGLSTLTGQTVSTNCAVLAITPALPNTSFPKTFTIDFGTSNCQGLDGALRRGQIIATLSGRFHDSLTVITITTNNYFFNNNQISGTYTIRNKGRNAAGHPWYSETVANSSSIRPAGNAIAWNSAFTREWIVGDTSSSVFGNVFLVSGKATGVTSQGNSIAVFTNTSLRFAMNCPWFESGTLYLNPTGLASRFIDFGTGACDNHADVWIFGNKYTLYLD